MSLLSPETSQDSAASCLRMAFALKKVDPRKDFNVSGLRRFYGTEVTLEAVGTPSNHDTHGENVSKFEEAIRNAKDGYWTELWNSASGQAHIKRTFHAIADLSKGLLPSQICTKDSLEYRMGNYASKVDRLPDGIADVSGATTSKFGMMFITPESLEAPAVTSFSPVPVEDRRIMRIKKGRELTMGYGLSQGSSGSAAAPGKPIGEPFEDEKIDLSPNEIQASRLEDALSHCFPAESPDDLIRCSLRYVDENGRRGGIYQPYESYKMPEGTQWILSVSDD